MNKFGVATVRNLVRTNWWEPVRCNVGTLLQIGPLFLRFEYFEKIDFCDHFDGDDDGGRAGASSCLNFSSSWFAR